VKVPVHYLAFLIQIFLLAITLGVVVKFSWEIGKRKFMNVDPVMHNKCYTDAQRIEMTHGHSEPHI
tara:strand:- start:87 stop:284 length:198 start_codon:yes stop_codon:yes gene_type:complete